MDWMSDEQLNASRHPVLDFVTDTGQEFKVKDGAFIKRTLWTCRGIVPLL